MLDDVEVARQEKARSFQIAREYLEGAFFRDVWTMRAVLEGEITAMARLLKSCTDTYEVQQMFSSSQFLQRKYRILELQKSEVIRPLLVAAVEVIGDATLWAHMPETQVQRSTIFRAGIKTGCLGMAVVGRTLQRISLEGVHCP